MTKILVTGATGFVGRHLVARLVEERVPVRCAVRNIDMARHLLGESPDFVTVDQVDGSTDWSHALREVTAVFHLAARAHILEETAANPLQQFMRINTDGTRALAEQSIGAGVKRFVLVSSIKVNGESSGSGAFRADDPPAPVDPYGVSKHLAEEALWAACRTSTMAGVVIRPPLVYGPGVGANFLRLLRLVERGVPLPFGRVMNRRSLVSVWNLCDLLFRCSQVDAAANRTFMVSDGQDLSTRELVLELANALGKPARLLDVPPSWLRVAARLTGQMAEYTRLCASLAVDMSDTVNTLHWAPPLGVRESMTRTVSASEVKR